MAIFTVNSATVEKKGWEKRTPIKTNSRHDFGWKNAAGKDLVPAGLTRRLEHKNFTSTLFSE